MGANISTLSHQPIITLMLPNNLTMSTSEKVGITFSMTIPSAILAPAWS